MKDFLMPTLFIIIMTYTIYKHRKNLKQLTKLQIIGVGISYLVATLFAFILIYYGGNWIAGEMPNIILKYLVFTVVVCIALYLTGNILTKALQKVTNGILPKN